MSSEPNSIGFGCAEPYKCWRKSADWIARSGDAHNVREVVVMVMKMCDVVRGRECSRFGTDWRVRSPGPPKNGTARVARVLLGNCAVNRQFMEERLTRSALRAACDVIRKGAPYILLGANNRKMLIPSREVNVLIYGTFPLCMRYAMRIQ